MLKRRTEACLKTTGEITPKVTDKLSYKEEERVTRRENMYEEVRSSDNWK